MTNLTSVSTVRRETGVTYRKRVLCVSLHAQYLEIWPKGLRTHVTVDYQAILDLAWKLKHRAEKAEAAAKKRVDKNAKKREN